MSRRSRSWIGPTTVLLFAFSVSAQPEIPENYYFVDPGGSGAGGHSWARAFKDLATALGVIGPGDRVIVAEGTYFPTQSPTSSASQAISFNLPQGCSIEGGYRPGDLVGYPTGDPSLTILSGLIQPILGWNSYHVVRVESPTVTGQVTTLKDLVIEDGAADTYPDVEGGGVYSINSTLHMVNVLVRVNGADVAGGGIYANGGTLELKRCLILENGASSGGGVWSEAANVVAHNTTFEDNLSYAGGSGRGGGIGMWLPVDGTCEFMNCLFWINGADKGSAAWLKGWSDDIRFTNCTVTQNVATIPGAGALEINPPSAASALVQNSIVYDNGPAAPYLQTSLNGPFTVAFSDIEGGWPGAGNINVDPLFIAPAVGDFDLSFFSPCTNAGKNRRIAIDVLDVDDDQDTSEQVDIDIEGDFRIRAGVVDMGAYEGFGDVIWK